MKNALTTFAVIKGLHVLIHGIAQESTFVKEKFVSLEDFAEMMKSVHKITFALRDVVGERRLVHLLNVMTWHLHFHTYVPRTFIASRDCVNVLSSVPAIEIVQGI